MARTRPLARALLGALACVALCAGAPGTALAQAPTAFAEFPVPNGRFYSQASGQGNGAGFAISDDGGIALWREFQRIGGVEAVGYPASRRFEQGGFVHQATQRFVLQWRPELGRTVYANAFDLLSAAGKDEWLRAERMIPPPADFSGDRALPWDQVVARHLMLLDQNPALKEAYLATPDAINVLGLPQAYADMGPAFVLRCQRAAFQLWKTRTPFARAGEITTVLGGDLVKEAGLLPPEAVAPEPVGSALIAPPGAPIRAEASVLATARRIAEAGRSSTVEIVAPHAGGESQGTGIVLDGAGHVLTNNHVVENARQVLVVLPDGRKIPASAVARDRLTDLAVITAPIPAGAVRPATLGDASALKAGDHVVAVGYTRYFPTPPTQRIGVYGGRDADVVDMLRTETFILPGDSGGPLFDLRGNLIGINSSIRLSRRASQPIVGMSIDAALAAPIVAELIEKGRIARPFLGVSTVSLTPALAGSTGLRTNNGALVTAVTPGSPAARAGIRADEAIVSIGGQPVRSTRELASQLTRHRVDEEVAVGLIGPAGPRSVRARLAETPV